LQGDFFGFFVSKIAKNFEKNFDKFFSKFWLVTIIKKVYNAFFLNPGITVLL